jgi:predicted Zn finger-like uncharacterized protein
MKMIIECEKCASKFSLDETLLKSEGSKVKCSICKHVFTAYPRQDMSDKEPIADKALEEDSKKVRPFDSADADFDAAFERAIAEAETEEAVSEEIAYEEDRDEFAEEPDMEPDEDETIAPKKRKGLSKRLILVLSIALLIAIGGAMIYLSLRNSSEKQESSDPGVMRLSYKAVTGSFVESNAAGQLFVIKGVVTNNYPKPRSYILLRGSIQDDKGKTVRTAVAYAGNTFSEKEIREMSLADLQKRQENRSGDEERNVNIPSEGSVPFMIIFEKLPEDIAEFTVEAVSSAPGK